MFRLPMGHAERQLAAAIVISMCCSLLLVPAVKAHCSGNFGYWYSSGDRVLNGGTDAAFATIQWTNPNVCSESVSHGVSMESDTTGQWVQVGWVKDVQLGHTAPRGYCEMENDSAGRKDRFLFTITSASHDYSVRLNSSNNWLCQSDGVTKMTHSSAWVGFNTGHYVVAQGEAHEFHAQIGRNAPSKLSFLDMQYRTLGTMWWTLNVVPNSPPSPYDNDEPLAGQLRVWTNAH